MMDQNFLIRLATECPLNLVAVAFGRETFERIGLFRTDLPMMADWEWYVRSAVHRGWLHLPERLRHLADRPRASAHPLGRLREPSRFPQNAQILSGRCRRASPPPCCPRRELCELRRYLAGAAECLRNGRVDLAARNVSEAFALGEAAAVVPEFAELIRRPDAGWLRAEMRTAGLAASGPSAG